MSKNIIGSHKTTASLIDNVFTVIYHETPIVQVFPHEIILNTGGWFTSTTKTRMNQASNQNDLGYQVRQIGGVWFAIVNGEKLPFRDNLCVIKRSYAE